MYDKSIVASGHHLVSRTAAQILREGGNAFDAIVAAGFASSVVEPALTSMGGGGFLLGRSEKHGQDLFFDFFVDTPGVGRNMSAIRPDFFPVTVQFSGSTQDFNVGLGSVAVPGTLKGLLHVQKRLGRMGLRDILTPAVKLAKEHVLNEQQGHFLKLLYPIMTMSTEGRAVYEPEGSFLTAGAKVRNPVCAAFLEQLADDQGESFYLGETARLICRDMDGKNGLLTRQDLARYEVKERKPLKLPYRGYSLLTTPEPSVGGTLIGLSLSLMEKRSGNCPEWGSGSHLADLVSIMQAVEELREQGVTTPARLQAFLDSKEELTGGAEPFRMFSRGTTQVSVSDRDGNCASMTCSNGEGSGYFAPETGVMLNNMMGEDDLHPEGFHSSPPGIRVGSMMSPSLLKKDDQVRLVIGSGGSKRIRIAISQVLSQMVDYGRELESAVNAPRLYWDGNVVQAEPGFTPQAIEVLRRHVPVNVWEQYDVYFGGVHGVVPGESGAGDPRRGGAVEIINEVAGDARGEQKQS